MTKPKEWTRDKILAMEPGRELDALVAEKVMGWQHQREFWVSVPTEIPHYSTDISAAWEVVEKVDNIEIEKRMDEDDDHIYRVKTGKYVVVSNSLPEAICKVALLAVLNL